MTLAGLTPTQAGYELLEFMPIAFGLGIGLLVGLERGWRERARRPGLRIAGIRTFGLLGMLGGVGGQLRFGAVLVALAGVALLVGYYRQAADKAQRSATTTIAGLIVLALGMLAAQGKPAVALAGAATVTFLLSNRQPLHRWLSAMNQAEMRAAARFAIIALALMPLLPDRGFGPFEAMNPRRLLAIVVAVSGLSFAAYLASRRLGSRSGALLTAACGAMVSSTAVTVALARKMHGPDDGNFTLGILLASLVSGARVLLLIAVLAPFAFLPALTGLAPGLLLLSAAMGWRLRTRQQSTTDFRPALSNPLDLRSAAFLALLTLACLVLTGWAASRFGHLGSAFVLALTGVVDVDAAVMAFSSLPAGEQRSLAAVALTLPVAFNMGLKSAIALILAPNRAGRPAAATLLLSAIVIAGASVVLGPLIS